MMASYTDSLAFSDRVMWRLPWIQSSNSVYEHSESKNFKKVLLKSMSHGLTILSMTGSSRIGVYDM